MKATKQLKKALCTVLAGGLVLGCLAGCGGGKEPTTENPAEGTAALQETEESPSAIKTEEPSAPEETEEPSAAIETEEPSVPEESEEPSAPQEEVVFSGPEDRFF